ncbi:hypothetical protein AB6A40_000574 [Gnathostoma spinigerum]|uniref:tRNA (uracil(54)-C(5))-methyltransferase n=1 Tax=Gnathostoma spinigerum TaxID=75299 RepID=A0ABD6E2D9_9BILA
MNPAENQPSSVSADTVASPEQVQSEHENDEINEVDAEKNQASDERFESDDSKPCDNEINEQRILLKHLPYNSNFKQVKKFIEKQLGALPYRKLRKFSDRAYFTLNSADEVTKAIELLNGFTYKGRKLSAEVTTPEPLKGYSHKSCDSPAPSDKSAQETLTPYYDLPYSEQLDKKMKNSQRLATLLSKQMIYANVDGAKNINPYDLVEKIRPSPRLTEYRNKCEFTVGKDPDGNTRVGSVGGKFSQNRHYIVTVNECTHISRQVKEIVTTFERFVIDSGEAPFDEFERTGFWKMLTVREFSSDVMLIVTTFPMDNEEKEALLKQKFAERFLAAGNLGEDGNRFRVTSVYWCTLKDASYPVIYEFVGGAPYVYETILDTRFRISPGAFFQTNSFGVEVLYSVIAEKCGIMKNECLEAPSLIDEGTDAGSFTGNDLREDHENTADQTSNDDSNSETGLEEEVEIDCSDIEIISHDKVRQLVNARVEEGPSSSSGDSRSLEVEESVRKRARMNEEREGQFGEQNQTGSEANLTVILDICCGTGTIGLCLLNMVRKNKLKKKVFIFGVEVIDEAIKDAEYNAVGNEFPRESFRFVTCKAESVLKDLKDYLPGTIDLDKAEVIGILDPPRAGVHERVIRECRKLQSLRRLLFVSCYPSLVMKNLVDLCRPRSRRYEGDPFHVTSIAPVDMFPQTKHFEWVVQLDR